MKFQWLSIVLTIVNFVILLIVLIVALRPVITPDVAPVLRGRALEIVDDGGKVRAEIIVVPASSMQDGQAYPETVLFRLINSDGRPNVKIDTSVEGSGLLLLGDPNPGEWSGVQILAKGEKSILKLQNKDGQEQVIQP